MNKVKTELEAYFLGWMFSDGCVTYNNKAQVFCTKLKIQEKDKDVLKLFDSFVNWTYGHEINKENNCKYSFIRTYDKKFTTNLIKLGVLPRKSVENSKFIFLPELKENLIPYFVRGLFDGDGCYSVIGNNRLNISLRMSNYFLILDLKNWLLSNNIESTLRVLTKNRKTPLTSLRIRNNENCLKFKNLIFKDNLHLALSRKLEIILNCNYSPTGFISQKKAVGVYTLEGKLINYFKSAYQISKLSKNQDFILLKYSEKGKRPFLTERNISQACRTETPYRGLLYLYEPSPYKMLLNGETPEVDNPVLNQ